MSLKISVASLNPADKEGFLTKQGGAVKSWRRRWFVLKAKRIIYFTSRNTTKAKGIIELEPKSSVDIEDDGKQAFKFSVSTSRRIYHIIADNSKDMSSWIDAIRGNIHAINNPAQSRPPPIQRQITVSLGISPSYSNPTAPKTSAGALSTPLVGSGEVLAPRARLAAAKSCIPFLLDESNKVLEFWQIWVDSVPPRADINPGNMIEFYIAASVDMQKLSWRVSGPQNLFIQRMVDFFWNVGAPESEIDRLNEVGAIVNPAKIGSWIDMSSKGGMDGGWFFPVEIPLKHAIEAADSGGPIHRLASWSHNNGISLAFSLGRDMGAAPPRQTEIYMKLPGSDFSHQLKIALDAFIQFEFPPVSEDVVALIRRSASSSPLCLSIITSSEGFVRMGLQVSKPSNETIMGLCKIGGGNQDTVSKFQSSIQSQAPAVAEYQYVMDGFGYGVYKEGADIVFHYLVGEERG